MIHYTIWFYEILSKLPLGNTFRERLLLAIRKWSNRNHASLSLCCLLKKKQIISRIIKYSFTALLTLIFFYFEFRKSLQNYFLNLEVLVQKTYLQYLIFDKFYFNKYPIISKVTSACHRQRVILNWTVTLRSDFLQKVMMNQTVYFKVGVRHLVV